MGEGPFFQEKKALLRPPKESRLEQAEDCISSAMCHWFYSRRF